MTFFSKTRFSLKIYSFRVFLVEECFALALLRNNPVGLLLSHSMGSAHALNSQASYSWSRNAENGPKKHFLKHWIQFFRNITLLNARVNCKVCVNSWKTFKWSAFIITGSIIECNKKGKLCLSLKNGSWTQDKRTHFDRKN